MNIIIRHEDCTETCSKHGRQRHIVKRWVLYAPGREIIAYGDESVIGAIQTKYNALASRRAGHFEYCTNTVVCNDLCDFADPKQYLPWQSHNQPHKG